MTVEQLIVDKLDLWTSATTAKATSGRGRNGKLELTGLKKLRELILELAVPGKLVPQDPTDEPASVLLEKIAAEKARLVKEGKIKKPKALPEIAEDEKPFELPKGWEWVRLGTMFNSIISGGTPSKNNPDFWGGAIPWASVKDLGKSKIIHETQDFITDAGLNVGSKLSDTGDILICTRMGLGKIAICGRPIAINQDLKAIKLSSCISINFFFLAYSTLNITGTGTTVAGITQEKLLNYVLACPPLTEQQRIVEKVDELMRLCDRIENRTLDHLAAHETLVDTLLDTLTQADSAAELADNWGRLAAHFDTLFTTEHSIDRLKQTILQLAVMGRLVPQDPTDEPASVLLEKIAAEKARLVKEGKIKKPKVLDAIGDDEKPFEVPNGWECVRFQEFTSEISTGPFGSMIHQSDYSKGGIPLINPSHMLNGSILEDSSIAVDPQKAKELSAYILNAGDIIMARRGEVGRCALVTEREGGWLCGTGSFVLRFYQTLSRPFIILLFNAQSTRQYLTGNSVGTTMTNLNHGILNKMPVLIPPLAEQHRIVQKVDALMALCDQLKARLAQADDTRRHLATALVDQAIQ